MSIQADSESVDLTEDEGSSDGNFSHKNSPLHFIDCTKPASSVFPVIANTTPRLVEKSLSPNSSRHLGLERIPNNKNKNLKSCTDRSIQKNVIGKFLSVQIKPPTEVIPETQDVPEVESNKLETVCLDSDEDSMIAAPEQQNVSNLFTSTAYSPKPMGKVVVIKKNNKYYKIVIPHNVMPDISQSVGPVLINIPEVGPLVITTDPTATRRNATSRSQVTQQLLNLDAIDHIQNREQSCIIKKKKPEIHVKDPREAMLCDKKYCWTFVRGRKRDLDGFTFNDRLGFNVTQAKKAKKCWKTLESIVSKKEKELVRLMHAYGKFKDNVRRKKKTIRLVKINEIVGKLSNQVNENVTGQRRASKRKTRRHLLLRLRSSGNQKNRYPKRKRRACKS